MIFKDIDLKELFRLMQEHDIDETTLQNGKTVVSVKRNKEPVVLSTGAVSDQSFRRVPADGRQTAPGDVKLPEDAGANKGDIETNSESTDDSAAASFLKIKAPLVGTFYRSSSPDASPYVEVGDQVNPGDVLCIVEAMKSMNEIQADVKGVVKEVCVQNAQLVEFDQTMFKIEPN